MNQELVALRALVTELTNKLDSKYLKSVNSGSLSYDTGATPTSFVKDKPNNFIDKPGILYSAGEEGLPTLGSGSIFFGQIETPATHVPSISRNLVSGIALMKQGYTRIIANNHMILTSETPKVSKESILATEKYSKRSGLLDLDYEVDPNVSKYFSSSEDCNAVNAVVEVTQKEAHDRFGHPGDATLKQTIPLVDGLKITSPENKKPQQMPCEPCIMGKMRLPNIPKHSKRTFKRLEMLSGDTQGPFRVMSNSGTRMNLKFVDSATKYAKMFEIADGTASTALFMFKSFLARLERRTGDVCKYFSCDDGTEFKGPFHDYLEEVGIQKNNEVYPMNIISHHMQKTYTKIS
jgi:hypothetical protein